MPLILNRGSQPNGLMVAVRNEELLIGDYCRFEMSEFLKLVLYVLTSTNLRELADPRDQFILCLGKIQTVKGYDGLDNNTKRLHSKVVPVLGGDIEELGLTLPMREVDLVPTVVKSLSVTHYPEREIRIEISLTGSVIFYETRETSWCCGITGEDFFKMVYYVLTNTNLLTDSDDPRLSFVKTVQGMRIVPGFQHPYIETIITRRLAVSA